MVFGITGNAEKEQIWEPVRRLIKHFVSNDVDFVVAHGLAPGLLNHIGGQSGVARSVPGAELDGRFTADYASACDVVLSFGGDGTLLNTVYEIGDHETPVLGINLGRLGFLALVDESKLEEAVDAVVAGRSGIEERRMLRVTASGGEDELDSWGLNEVVITRTGVAGLLTLDVHVNGEFLNSYWADGLILSTPTGSTAYNLSAGGPIISPGSEGLAITPLAPHSLTERPIVVPLSAKIRVSARGVQAPYVVAVDGRSSFIRNEDTVIDVGRAARKVRLVTLPGQDYFETLRSKLSWGSPRKE